MGQRVTATLGSILANAMATGAVARNVVREQGRMTRRQSRLDKRHARNIEVGVDVPTKDEIRAILTHARGRWRPLLVTAIFTGLRASELRGLRWSDVDLDRAELTVRQRADRWGAIGSLSPHPAGEQCRWPRWQSARFGNGNWLARKPRPIWCFQHERQRRFPAQHAPAGTWYGAGSGRTYRRPNAPEIRAPLASSCRCFAVHRTRLLAEAGAGADGALDDSRRPSTPTATCSRRQRTTALQCGSYKQGSSGSVKCRSRRRWQIRWQNDPRRSWFGHAAELAGEGRANSAPAE